MRVYEAAKRLGLEEAAAIRLINETLPMRHGLRGEMGSGNTGSLEAATNRMSSLTDEEFWIVHARAEKRQHVQGVVQPLRPGVVRRKQVSFTDAPVIVVEPGSLERVLYEHGRGPLASPWKAFRVKLNEWQALCSFGGGRVTLCGALDPSGAEVPADSYPAPMLGTKALDRGKIEWMLEAIVRAVATVGLSEERRDSDLRILLPADAETEDRTVYVYLSKEWLESVASHCVLIRKGTAPHMRRGHSRAQRCGPGRAQTKQVWIADTSVKRGESWAEYRVRPQKKKPRPK